MSVYAKKIIVITIDETDNTTVAWDTKEFKSEYEVMGVLYAMANKMRLALREKYEIDEKDKEK